MEMRHRLLGIFCLLIGLGYNPASQAALTLDELETQLDFTIRSACHGYMIDAIPDFLSSAREWLNRETPVIKKNSILSALPLTME